MLYVISTPIGNLQDITLRAIEMLKTLKIFFVEDTREFKKLLQLLQISYEDKVIHSYASHNLKEATEKALQLLADNQSIGLATDRGTPGVSDPGALLVQKALEALYKVVPIPGVSAVTTLFSVAGLTQSQFLFLGFLPEKNKERMELFNKVSLLQAPICFYESPERITDTLNEFFNLFPTCEVFIGREMTKQYEEYFWINKSSFEKNALTKKGEFTVLVKNIPLLKQISEIDSEIALKLASEKDWSKVVGDRLGIPSKDAYNKLQETKRNS
jgi:16S rRNA (cytidine1402-2'-O)-methyltransferase